MIPIHSLDEAYYFVKNLRYYILFFFVEHLPVQFCVWVYHIEILGIGRLAELRKIHYMDMYDYIKKYTAFIFINRIF